MGGRELEVGEREVGGGGEVGKSGEGGGRVQEGEGEEIEVGGRGVRKRRR